MSDPRKALDNLTNHMVDDIMSLTEEELLAEAEEDGIDVDATAERCRRMFEQVIEKQRRNGNR